MERTPLESKAVLSAGYDPDACVLEVEFPSGEIYQYLEVPAEVHAWFLRVPAQGAFLNRFVKDRYEFRRVTPEIESPLDLTEALLASLESLREK